MRSVHRALLLGLLALLVGACYAWPNGGAGPGGHAPVLRVALPADVVTLDPAAYTDVHSDHVASQIHETLFTVDFDLRIVPLLAERLEQPDDRTYVLPLRRGVRFHNGDELTADDVVFSLNRVIDPATRSPRAGRLSEPLGASGRIEALDPYTVRITLSTPYAPFLERLTQPYSAILSRRAVPDAAPYGEQPVGTGPFRFVERRSGDSVILERNGAYWGERAHVAGLLFRTIPDSATRIASLETGEVDHTTYLPADEVARLQADQRFTTQVAPAIGVTLLGFNTTRAPLVDPLVRRAIAHAVDREEIVRTIFAGTGRAATTALSPASWAYEPNAGIVEPDFDEARALLAQSSYRGGEIELATTQTPELRQTAERLQGVLKEQLGLPVRLNVMEWGAFLNYLKGGEQHQMYLIGWSGLSDPDSVLFPLFHSRNWGPAGNRAWYKNDQVDALLERAQTTLDQSTRAELYRQAQRLIAQDVPVLPLRHGVNTAATSSRFVGYALHPLGRAVYTDVRPR